MSKQTELAQVADTITVNSGNVGIGITPTAKLHLGGTNPNLVFGTSGNELTYLQRYNDDFYIFNKETTGSMLFGTANLERMRIDSAGRVTMPYQPAAFVAKDNGGSWTTFSGTMVFNDVKLNRGNCYNSSTGIFTCPAAGVYRVHAEALTGNATASCHVRVYKNGSSVVASGAHSNYQGSTYYTIGTEALVQCAVNDQLSVFMSSSTNALYQAADYTKATFMMVG